jgi:hypothetical protein
VLALALGKTLKQIGRMTPAELESWRVFYQHFPFDDFHRFHRPAALVSASMASGDINDVIAQRVKWLAPQQSKHPNESGWSEAELNSFKAHGITPPKRG